MKLSRFGEKYTAESGIVSLMEDLGEALNVNPKMIFMGGGNPAHIPAVENRFRELLIDVAQNEKRAHKMLGVYQSPQGDQRFLRAIAKLFRNEFGWEISEKNIAITNGSQSAFSMLFNVLAGEFSDGSQKQILFPLAPEYIGYADLGLHEHFFRAQKPEIEILDDDLFKYHVDFDNLEIDETIGAICVSRPTNPTGNVLTDVEIAHLDQLAQQNDIPLILDGAYGTPFPNIIFTDVQPFWNENTVLALSLSKLGLPGTRTGILIANEEIIRQFTHINALLNLACGNLGPAIAAPLFESGEILKMSREQVQPFYQQRSQRAVGLFREALGNLPYFIHKPEGAIFLWIWFKDLPISSQTLYERLKQKGVLIISGHHFFAGLEEDWPHKNECIRVNYSQDEKTVAQGVALIAEEVRRAYQQ